MIDLNEFAENIINERILLLNQYISHVDHIYKISKIFILTDFIINIQKEIFKNKSKLFKYTFNKNLSKNYKKSYLISNFDKYLSKNLNEHLSKNLNEYFNEHLNEHLNKEYSEHSPSECNFNEILEQNSNEILEQNPNEILEHSPFEKNHKDCYRKDSYGKDAYVLLFKNYHIISNMIYNLSFKQRKSFLRLNSYMKSCDKYDKNILKKFNKCSYKEYTQSFRKCINLLIAYDSYITNEDIVNCISFIAFQLNLIDENNENKLIIKSWNDLYDYCSEHCFGFVLNTYEQYINFINKHYCSYYINTNIIEDAFLTFEHYESILNELINQKIN